MLRNYVQAASNQLTSKAFMVISDVVSSVQKYIQVCSENVIKHWKWHLDFQKIAALRFDKLVFFWKIYAIRK